VKVDKIAKDLALNTEIKPHIFNIIYDINKFIGKTIKERTPKKIVEEKIGKARIIRVFNRVGKKQVIGASAIEGTIKESSDINVIRNETVIGQGKIHELQIQKMKQKEVEKGVQFGALIDTKTELALGDILEAFEKVEK
jgi:translation initiation factor IF-2